jgi:hypothetical protein
MKIKKPRWTGIVDVKLIGRACYVRQWRAARRELDVRVNLFNRRNVIA